MRGRNRLFGALALAALAGAVALVVVLVGGGGKGGRKATRPDHVAAVRAQASVSPNAFLFGDTVTARVAILLDGRRVQSRDVKLDARFYPYSPISAPARYVRTAGPLTLVTYSFRLRCLAIACLPRVVLLHLQFAPARVRYHLGKGSGSLRLSWPPLLVYSRVDLPDLANVNPDREPPWRAELTSLPRVSYDVAPGLAAGLMIGAAGLLVLAALMLAGPMLLRALHLRALEPVASPLPPLERALRLLEYDGADPEAAEERRSALQLIAAELGRQGLPELASNARELAWSEPAPPTAAMKRLAKDARRVLHVSTNGHGA
jgi:hypothetical protein